MVEHPLDVRWVVGSIPYGGLIELFFLFQSVPHDWCNKGHGMCYPVCGMVHIKRSKRVAHVVALFSLAEWSFATCPKPYITVNVLSV